MTFTKTETIAIMHGSAASQLKRIADQVEKFKLNWQDVVNLLREKSDEQETLKNAAILGT